MYRLTLIVALVGLFIGNATAQQIEQVLATLSCKAEMKNPGTGKFDVTITVDTQQGLVGAMEPGKSSFQLIPIIRVDPQRILAKQTASLSSWMELEIDRRDLRVSALMQNNNQTGGWLAACERRTLIPLPQRKL